MPVYIPNSFAVKTSFVAITQRHDAASLVLYYFDIQELEKTFFPLTLWSLNGVHAKRSTKNSLFALSMAVSSGGVTCNPSCSTGFIDDVIFPYIMGPITAWRYCSSIVPMSCTPNTPAAWQWLRPVGYCTTWLDEFLVQGVPGRSVGGLYLRLPPAPLIPPLRRLHLTRMVWLPIDVLHV